MHVTFVSSNEENDPLQTIDPIPEKWKKYLQPNSEKRVFKTKYFQYLEQLYGSENDRFALIDFLSCGKRTGEPDDYAVYPAADSPMLVITFMIDGSVPCEVSGFGTITLIQGFAYMFYLPEKNSAQSPDTYWAYKGCISIYFSFTSGKPCGSAFGYSQIDRTLCKFLRFSINRRKNQHGW